MAKLIIKQGDTLSGLATERGTTVDELLRLNPNIQDPNLIFAGATLQIPEEIVAPQEQVTPPGEPLVTAPEVIEGQTEQTRAVATAEEAAGITEENQVRLAEMEAGIVPPAGVPAVPPVPTEEITKAETENSRQNTIDDLVRQGITDPNQILDFVNLTETGEKIGDFTIEEVTRRLQTAQPEQTFLRESIESIDREVVQFTSILDARATQLDTANQALVDSIKSIFNRRREQQKEVNKNIVSGLTITGIRAGRQRFAPEVQEGILSAAERDGIQRIADLDAQELSLIQEAKAANDANQFALLNAKMNEIATARKDKSAVIKQLHDMAVEEEKLLRERAQEGRAARREIRDIAREREPELLSLAEARDLGVPFGTTVQQAVELGIIPPVERAVSDPFFLEGIGTVQQELATGKINVLRPIPTPPTGRLITPTASQFEAAQFGTRTQESGGIISGLGDQIARMSGISFGLQSRLPRGLQSEIIQSFDQAQRNFINATLRRESGAAIAESEFENARLQYIPQPGDRQLTLEQKRRNRETVTNFLLQEGAPVLEQRAGLAPTTEPRQNTVTQGDFTFIINEDGSFTRIE